MNLIRSFDCYLRNAKITTKLNLLAAAAVSTALLMCWTAFAVNEVMQMLGAKERQVAALAKSLAYNVIPALEFDDFVAARETLEALSANPTICCATIWRDDGSLFAEYRSVHEPASRSADQHGRNRLVNGRHDATANSGGEKASAHRHGQSWAWIPQRIKVELPIHGHAYGASTDALLLDGPEDQTVASDRPTGAPADVDARPVIGRIAVYSTTDDIKHQFLVHTALAIPVVVLALFMGLAIAKVIQRRITEPVRNLAATAQQIAHQESLELRAQKYGNDEIGQLCDAFNEMVERLDVKRQELKQANEELEQRVAERTRELADALERATAASRAKSDFLANMSHEIRTPMTAVLGYAELLCEDPALSSTNRERVEIMLRNGRHLLTIINDILDVSKIEAGKMTVEMLDCSICEIVADLFSLLRPRAIDKGLQLEVRYLTSIPKTIRTDPTRLRQILLNLLGNAIKYTQKGSVELLIRLNSVDGPAPYVEFQVKDTGIGLTKSQLEKVFMAFTQADETMTRRFGGTGLGLTISKGLAELLGGSISVESEFGKGSTFTLRIPAGEIAGVEMVENCRELLSSDHRPREAAAEVGKIDARILLVEDGTDNQRLLSFILKRAGAEVTIAENGKVGMEKVLEAWRSGSPFDIVLMDMQMPVMDGYTATSNLRKEGYQLPIIALTAHAMSHDRGVCLNAGCDDFVTKPVDRRRLLQVCQEWTEKSRAQRGDDAKASSAEATGVPQEAST
ncbi:MAG: hypothetical protein KatS3mg111_1423 [Pirellulaceae bacterium]|nr:MAG: hypothetical protein KatS3mg111_1423 [Pirellulaceae bacterium]